MERERGRPPKDDRDALRVGQSITLDQRVRAALREAAPDVRAKAVAAAERAIVRELRRAGALEARA